MKIKLRFICIADIDIQQIDLQEARFRSLFIYATSIHRLSRPIFRLFVRLKWEKYDTVENESLSSMVQCVLF